MMQLNLYGPMNQLGYGIHFSNWAGAVADDFGSDLKTVIIPRGARVDLPKDTDDWQLYQKRAIPFIDPTKYDPQGVSISLWHLSNMAEFAGKLRLGYSVWEGSRLKPGDLEQISKLNGIIVPTWWHKEQLADQPTPVFVIPEGFCPETFKYRGSTGMKKTLWNQLFDIKDHETIFVNVGKFEQRKGVDVLLPAINALGQETPRTAMRFIFHWANPFIRDWQSKAEAMIEAHGFKLLHTTHEGIHAITFHHKKTDDILITLITGGKPITTQQIADLYRTAHFGVWPYFAEGWGLPVMESMACGLPPICQNYSGPTEYLEEGCYIPLASQEILANDGMFFHGDQGTWRRVNQDSLSNQISVSAGMDEDARVDLGERASASVSPFAWNRKPVQCTKAMLKEIGVL